MDQRSITFERSLKIGEEYERRTKLMILRAAMLKAHIQVKVFLFKSLGGLINK
jgi:COP9 signalosome complex subunit 1